MLDDLVDPSQCRGVGGPADRQQCLWSAHPVSSESCSSPLFTASLPDALKALAIEKKRVISPMIRPDQDVREELVGPLAALMIDVARDIDNLIAVASRGNTCLPRRNQSRPLSRSG